MIKIENYEVVGWEHAIRGMRNPHNSWANSDSYFLDDDGDMYTIYGNHAPFHGDDNGNGPMSLGKKDLELMMKLAKGGSVHAKYRRMITVYVDITAPLYWWKEFDTYKVGTVANSCSTMHKIHEKEFTLEDFSCEHLINVDDIIKDKELVNNLDIEEQYKLGAAILDRGNHDLMEVETSGGVEYLSPTCILEQYIIGALNLYRAKFLETKNKPMKDEAARKALMKKYWWQMIQLLPSSYNQKRTVMFNYEVLANIYKWRRNHKMGEGHWDVVCDWIESLPYSEIITGPALKDIPIANEIMEEAKRRILDNDTADKKSPYHPMREDVTGGGEE